MQVNCPLQSGRCPVEVKLMVVYNDNHGIMLLSMLHPTVYTGCPYGPDDVWNIIWPNTPGGSISYQPCTAGGVDAIGLSS